MINDILGLHHVTSFAGDPQRNNNFFTQVLGLRRVKKTVNFDAPDVYHLYYGDAAGTPGTVMTYFPFPNIGTRQAGTGEVGVTRFAVPKGAIDYWIERMTRLGVAGLKDGRSFGARELSFTGVDGDAFALIETENDRRAPWLGGDVNSDHAIRGFHSGLVRLRDGGATAELLRFMGYRELDTSNGVQRFVIGDGTQAQIVDVEVLPGVASARPGSGSVHHIAFAVPDRAAHARVRQAIADTGYQVTPFIDRDYFWSIYFRTPGGVLFEIATNEPGFARDEEPAHLGEALKLPKQHEHLRQVLEKHLPVILD